MTATAQSAFDFAPAPDITIRRNQGSKYSRKANEATQPAKESRRVIVLKRIQQKAHYGATVEELSQDLNLRYTSASARVSELKADKLIFDSGRSRRTSTGCQAAVLVADPKFVEGMN